MKLELIAIAIVAGGLGAGGLYLKGKHDGYGACQATVQAAVDRQKAKDEVIAAADRQRADDLEQAQDAAAQEIEGYRRQLAEQAANQAQPANGCIIDKATANEIER